MCLIIVRPKKIKFDLDQIRLAWRHNSDGAGVSTAYGDKVHIRKGLMSLDSLLDYLLTNNGAYPQMVHLRTATHGEINKGNTHPFPVSHKLDDLTALEITCERALAHNGMIHSVGASKVYSDSQLFVHKFSKKINKGDYTQIHRAATEGNRFALILPSQIRLFGGFREIKGLYYSNVYHQVWDDWRFDLYDNDFPKTAIESDGLDCRWCGDHATCTPDTCIKNKKSSGAIDYDNCFDCADFIDCAPGFCSQNGKKDNEGGLTLWR